MATKRRAGTEHRHRYADPTAHYNEDPGRELADLPWHDQPHEATVLQAAAIVRHAWATLEDRALEDEYLQQLVSQIPNDRQGDVISAVLDPAWEPHPLPEHQLEHTAPLQGTDTRYPVPPADARLTHRAVEFAREYAGETAAELLLQALHQNRELPLADYRGSLDHWYPGDPAENYLQCVADLPAAVATKQSLEEAVGLHWDDHRLEQATQHEVNRLAYRQNLELRDRFLTHSARPQELATAARATGMSAETTQLLEGRSGPVQEWARAFQERTDPTFENVTIAVQSYLREASIPKIIETGDEAALLRMLEPAVNDAGLARLSNLAMEYLDEATLAPAARALELAATWEDATILEGAAEYHLPLAELGYEYANQPRERWLRSSRQEQRREREAGDCAARALNEATGGDNYQLYWHAFTRAKPQGDADSVTPHQVCSQVYAERGLRHILAIAGQPAYPKEPEYRNATSAIMRNHLDLREIPSLLGALADSEGGGATPNYVCLTEQHAVAVVDSVVRDNWDCREMGDRTQYANGRVQDLWLQADAATATAARDRINSYARVREYDEWLTHGPQLRSTTPGPGI